MEKKDTIKIRWLFTILAPTAFFIGIQLFTMAVVIGIYCLSFIPDLLQATGNDEIDFLLSQMSDNIDGIELTAQVFSQVYGVICFAVWYHYSSAKKSKVYKNSIKPRSIFYIIGLGISAQLLVGYLIVIAEKFVPDIIREYEEMLETAGLDEVSIAVVLTAVILAPIVEELAFRGCAISMGERSGCHFWIINIIQAAAFGAAHMNWVQSSYAFFLGLFLGYCYHKYHSLVASILLHFVFNMFGTVITSLIEGIAVMNLAIINYILFAVSIIATIALTVLISKDNDKTVYA